MVRAARIGVDGVAGLLHRLDERLVHGAGGNEHQLGRVERVGEVLDKRRDVVLAGELLDVARHDHALAREEGRGAGRVDDARGFVGLVTDVVDDQTAIVVADELLHELADPVGQKGRVGTADEVHRHDAGLEQGCEHIRRSSSAADVVRPQDAAPERDAERVCGDRGFPSLADVEVEEHAEEPLVRR